VKALEQPRQLIGWNAGAGIGDGKLEPAASCVRDTAIVPSNVNLKALERRLRTIFSHISRST
jgi:hypothetical protein